MKNPQQLINRLLLVPILGIPLILFGGEFGIYLGLALLLPASVTVLLLQIKYKDLIKRENLELAAKKGLNVSEAAIARRKKYGSILLAILFAGLAFAIFGYITEVSSTFILFILSFVIFFFGMLGMAIADYAERKGKSWEAFFWLSVLVSPILAAIIVAVMSADSNAMVYGTKRCPKCAEVIKVEAVLCKHCGSDLG